MRSITNVPSRNARRRIHALSLLLLWVYGCQPVTPEEISGRGGPEAPSIGTTSASLTSQFQDPSSYDATWGLPLEPSAANLTLAGLAARLGEESEAIVALRKVHENSAKVRFLEAYARDYPTFLVGNQALLPKGDGVHLEQNPRVTKETVNPAVHCNTTHLCEELYNRKSSSTEESSATQLADIIVLLGWDVEVAGPVFTEGRSLLIIAENFRGHGNAISTQPRFFRMAENESSPTKASNGRHGHPGGAFLLYTNVLDKLSVNASGMNGEPGHPGTPYVGGQITGTEMGGSASSPHLVCLGVNPDKDAQDGGDGSNGGRGGTVLVRYATLIGTGAPRKPEKTAPVSDWECFSDPALGCESVRCTNNPSVSICDVLTEADNKQCLDGIDNDGDGRLDCSDPDCFDNPFVTVCPMDPTATSHIVEGTPEACSDGFGSDCASTGCRYLEQCGGTEPIGPLYPYTSGFEESTNASCSNGLDDDGDGYTDCRDNECRYNSLVTVCTRENSVEACADGLDNDGDGYADCNDFDCSRNPYVKVCNASSYPFLAESSNATCSDGLDNDSDRYKDCRDYQCLNNPLVTVCGNQENSMAECSDGLDNDGDGVTDCSEGTCRENPFFGTYVCTGRIQTNHTQVVPPPTYNGVYLSAAISMKSAKGTRGAPGAKGTMLTQSRVVNTPPSGPIVYTCHLGRESFNGANTGQDGLPGGTELRFTPRRSTDILRSQLSPNQWVVNAALGNAHFKNGNAQKASFLFMLTLMRLRGVLADADIASCEELPATASLRQRQVAQNVCPTLGRVQLHFSRLKAGLDFYGQSREPRINPRNRYQALREDFDDRFELLKGNVDRYLTLSISQDLAAWFSIEGSKLQLELDKTALELDAANLRIDAAEAALDGLLQSINRRKNEYENTTEALQTYDASKQVSLGSFLLGLGKAALSAFGSEFLTKAGEQAFSSLTDALGGWFDQESGKKPATAEGKEESKDFLGSLTDIAGATAGSALKKAFAQMKPDLFKVVEGLELFPRARSTITNEVSATVASESQRRTINEYLDLVASLEKAKLDLEAAKMDAFTLRSHHASVQRLKQQVSDYVGQQAALSALDRLLLLKQTYAMTMLLLDDLGMRYWNVVRQAQYEKLPFSSQTGQSLLSGDVIKVEAFTFVNFEQMKLRLIDLDAQLNHFTSGQRAQYRRVTGNPFVQASTGEKEVLTALGLDYLNTPYLFHVNITYDGLNSTLLKHRIRDVRVNFLGTNGGTARHSIFLVRDMLDSFYVGRNASTGEPWIIDFELTDKDLASNGSVRSPLHYQSFLACTAVPPSCDLSQASCRTPFQDVPTADACSISGPVPDTAANVTFYDRSLAGNWTVVLPASDYTALETGLGGIQGVEVVFDTVAVDL
ncbi:hypothetical protein SAMN05444354_110115 [Stigmatella aurantiaca]|uniref:Uncharacterized protein n=1 Tax=Stigmatella aurantiaca TaxID=41 RepID=A0A1H7UME3_STIAU|nr:hypothetical protein [Stigmatella aurantiaca]SEL98200.1 hypothetical protein SAMN05444354_110115 [Stigmatella aurantiaca]